jgi:ADP-dependent phosphofructokinase/glucokinase
MELGITANFLSNLAAIFVIPFIVFSPQNQHSIFWKIFHNLEVMTA